jgi:tetrahydromethanopterin S-methyltransferase subunit G
MKKIKPHQIETLKNVLERLNEIKNVYEFNKTNLDINFPFVIGRSVGIAMVSAIELKVLIESLEDEKATN